MPRQPLYPETQAAIVHFRGLDIPVRVAPPGSMDHAVTAFSQIARKLGRGDLASAALNHRSECRIDWGTIHLTKKGQAEQEKSNEKPNNGQVPKKPRIEFPNYPITQQEVFARPKRSHTRH